MAKVPTLEQIRTWSPEERMRVRERAAARNDEMGRETVALIDNSNLPLRSSGGLSMDHPIYLEMEEVIWSDEGKTAALNAVAVGLPAMAHVDPLLQKRMGRRYSPNQQGTLNAGWIVAEFMRSRGYEPKGVAALPVECIAKTAALYVLRRPLR